MDKVLRPPSQICHVIFDLSEVLIYGLSGFQGAYAQELGITAENAFELFGGVHLHELLLGNILEEEYLSALIKKNAWDPAQMAAIKTLIRENFHQLVPNTIDIAMELSKKYPLTLLSDHAKEWAAYILEVHPFINQIFSRVYFSCQYGNTKRDAALFEIVLHDLNSQPEQCLFIDDSERNIAVASSIGLRVIQFKNANQLRQDLIHLGLIENPITAKKSK